MKTITNIILLGFIALVLALQPAAAQRCRRNADVIILHTNDMHARIDNFGKLAFLYDSLRGANSYVFLIAAGDNFTGNPIVDMYPDKGYPMIDVMNMAHFTLSAIGNHEFDQGQEILDKRRQQAQFPFICANIDASQTHFQQPNPFVLLKAGRVSIPVVAFIQLGANGLPDSHPSRLAGLKFIPAIEKAKEYQWLKKRYGILIGLTHLGVETDVPFAEANPFFDLIIGGHSHTLIQQPMEAGGAKIVQVGSGLKYVGKTTLHIRKGKLQSMDYAVIPMSSLKSTKAEVQAAIDQYNNNPEMNRVVGIAETPFSNIGELGSMMTDAITDQFGTDFAFQNNGGIRISSLPEGDIKLRNILMLDPFGNQVVTYKMTLAEIKSLLINAYNREKQIDLQTSGCTYTALVKPDGTCTDVEIKDRQGNLLTEDKVYTVGMNNYISAAYHFDHSDPGTVNYTTSAQTLLDYLAKVKKVNYAGVNRVAERKMDQ